MCEGRKGEEEGSGRSGREKAGMGGRGRERKGEEEGRGRSQDFTLL
jgi:hypothetical protein